MGKGLVFISYSSKERDFAINLAQQLKRAKLNVWIDRDGIKGGDIWIKKLEEALGVAVALIAVLSPNYVASRYCRLELSRAHSRSIPIFPLLYSHLGTVDMPLEIQLTQYIDFTDFANKQEYEKSLEKLINALEIFLLKSYIKKVSPRTPADILANDDTVKFIGGLLHQDIPELRQQLSSLINTLDDLRGEKQTQEDTYGTNSSRKGAKAADGKDTENSRLGTVAPYLASIPGIALSGIELWNWYKHHTHIDETSHEFHHDSHDYRNNHEVDHDETHDYHDISMHNAISNLPSFTGSEFGSIDHNHIEDDGHHIYHEEDDLHTIDANPGDSHSE